MYFVYFVVRRLGSHPLIRRRETGDLRPPLAKSGLPGLDEADGRSLVALLVDDDAVARSIPSALLRYPHAENAPQQFSLVDPEGLKALRIGNKSFAFDLRRDPNESGRHQVEANEVQQELARRVESYPARMREFHQKHGTPNAATVDNEELQRLRALGYIP